VRVRMLGVSSIITTVRRYGFLSVDEAARRLHRNPELVRRWLREGRLKGLTFGRSWVIPERELARFEKHQPKRRRSERDDG
jgi:excisionase family DNA binding protein